MTSAPTTITARYAGIAAQVADTDPTSPFYGVRIIPAEGKPGAYIIGSDGGQAIVLYDRAACAEIPLTISLTGAFLGAVRKAPAKTRLIVTQDRAVLELPGGILGQSWTPVSQAYPEILDLIRSLSGSAYTHTTSLPGTFFRALSPDKKATLIVHGTGPAGPLLLRADTMPEYLGIVMPVHPEAISENLLASHLPEWIKTPHAPADTPDMDEIFNTSSSRAGSEPMTTAVDIPDATRKAMLRERALKAVATRKAREKAAREAAAKAAEEARAYAEARDAKRTGGRKTKAGRKAA
jgi:hypothetical protein